VSESPDSTDTVPRDSQHAPRCFGDGDPLFERYHDQEWGFPVLDERGLFERLSLEAFQSGLSWRTILNKRPAFRAAFAEFDPDAIARFGGADVRRLLGDVGIIRNRAKIEATLANARATVAMRTSGQPLEAVIRAHEPARRDPPPATWADVPAVVHESVELARELKRRGFRFVGPTTLYALGSPWRMIVWSTSTPRASRCSWAASTSSVVNATPVSIPGRRPSRGRTRERFVAAPEGATSTQRSPSP